MTRDWFSESRRLAVGGTVLEALTIFVSKVCTLVASPVCFGVLEVYGSFGGLLVQESRKRRGV